MKIPILAGIYGSAARPDLGVAYPVNMLPVVLPSGVNDGYMRPADGIELKFNAPVSGNDRGGIAWDGVLYRVIGSKFLKIDESGTITVIGDVGSGGMCSFDYGYVTQVGKTFTAYLGIVSGGRFYLYSNVTNVLTEVQDPNINIPAENILGGPPIDMIWVDGYYMLTDGTYVYTTELTDPFTMNPLAYGTTDVDPDPIVALIKLRNEVYVLNRHTIQVLDNVGAPPVGVFTFQTIDGGQIQKGCIGTHACCVFDENIAYLGSGRNEAPGIYVGANANTQKISDVEIDRLLANYTETQLRTVVLEARNDNAFQHLYVHLPDRTLVFDATATRAFQRPVWAVLTSSNTVGTITRYKARSMVWCYDRWNVADPTSNNLGMLSTNVGTQWGANVVWEISTPIAYNDGSGALFHELELVSLPGRAISGTNPTISTAYSSDGITWSAEKSISAGTTGQYTKRLTWFQQGLLEGMRIQRFRGTSEARLSVIRLEARIEPLEY